MEERLQKFAEALSSSSQITCVEKNAASCLPKQNKLKRQLSQCVGLVTRSPAAEIAMKMITEYLDHAITFERMAAEEDNPAVKAQFEKQAKAYRKLATERAAQYGLPAPSPPETKSSA